MTERIDVGDARRVEASFYDSDGVLVDPTNVTITIRYEIVNEETVYTYGVDPSVKRTAVGQYYMDFVLAYQGRVYYAWRGTGNMDIMEQYFFTVLKSEA